MTQMPTSPSNAPRVSSPNGGPAQGVVEQAQEKMGLVADQAQHVVGQVTDQAKGQATSQLESQKERAVERLEAVAHLFVETGEHLRGTQHDTAAGYVAQAAERTEHLANYMRSRDLPQLVSDTRQMARQRPGLFLSGALALGFVGARFLLSSGQRAASTQPTSQSRPPLGQPLPGHSPTFGSSGRISPGASGGVSTGTPSSGLVGGSGVPIAAAPDVSGRPETERV